MTVIVLHARANESTADHSKRLQLCCLRGPAHLARQAPRWVAALPRSFVLPENRQAKAEGLKAELRAMVGGCL